MSQSSKGTGFWGWVEVGQDESQGPPANLEPTTPAAVQDEVLRVRTRAPSTQPGAPCQALGLAWVCYAPIQGWAGLWDLAERGGNYSRMGRASPLSEPQFPHLRKERAEELTHRAVTRMKYGGACRAVRTVPGSVDYCHPHPGGEEVTGSRRSHVTCPRSHS